MGEFPEAEGASIAAGEQLNSKQQTEIEELLQNQDTFSDDIGTLGHTKMVKHDINTGNCWAPAPCLYEIVSA